MQSDASRSRPDEAENEDELNGHVLGDEGGMKTSHILVKHQGSARKASWRDPDGELILTRTQQDATATLEELRAVSKNDESCIKNEGFSFKTRNFVFKMMNFAGADGIGGHNPSAALQRDGPRGPSEIKSSIFRSTTSIPIAVSTRCNSTVT